MSHSTPLDKIESEDGSAAATDEMRVQRILQEINGGGDESPGHQQGQSQYQDQGQAQHQGQAQGQGQSQQGQSQQGQQHQVPYHMYQPPHMPPQPPLMGPGMVPYDMMQQQQQQQEEQEYMHNLAAQQKEESAKKKNVWGRLTDAFKLPFVVACVFFILSLPVVDVQLSKYAHWAFSSGGQLSMTGIALKAVVAGTVMGIYDTIDSLVSRLF